MKKFTTIISSFLIALIVLASAPSAQAYYTTANDAQIAQLKAQIIYLQSILAAMLGNTSNINTGIITTGSVSNEGNGDVEFSGEVDPESSSSVKVWFEYGSSYALPYSTPMMSMSTGGSKRSFTATATDFNSYTNYYYRAVVEDHDGDVFEGAIRSFTLSGSWSNDNDDNDYNLDDDAPEVNTDDADDVDENSATLTGDVDMNDYEDGKVFIVYGEDEDAVTDVEDENEYYDINTDGDDLRKSIVDSNLDDDEDYEVTVTGLDDDTDHFYRFCVEFEDDENDEMLICGDVEEFQTDEY
jgi:hypothetical protein